MLNTIYANTVQFQDLLNAIQGGDTTAIATALGQIKASVDSITTALGSLSTDVTQNATQWSNLISAISAGSGGGNVTIDTAQWSNLLTEIAKGDTTAVITALGNINGVLGNIYTALGALSINHTQWGNLITALSTQRLIMQDSTQWTNLINAITNQSITVDLSNITSDVVTNESTVIPADTVTEALDVLKSDLSNLYATGTSGTKSGKGLTVRYNSYGKFVIIQCISALNTNVVSNEILITGLPKPIFAYDQYIIGSAGYGVYLTPNGELKMLNSRNSGDWITFTYMYLTA